ncbi:hypothetical protein Patl1_06264 [Pistacia atlantica]|uniref:Uncharacterized protein n=1 Tax=Pistacia atlantica TaxID=434234 RepID=A0ACC1BVS7_9ROSI|nr:hypothetical protein Patl1_06264 [Pistacia atlantica]
MATTITPQNKLTLKLMIDKGAKKVLFAEAGKDFVDVLFNLLSLNIRTIIKLLRDADMVGCTGNLYPSLENLNKDYLQPNQNKLELLKTLEKTSGLLLVPGASSQQQKKIYNCLNRCRYVADETSKRCPQCGSSMSYEVVSLLKMDSVCEGGIVNKLVTYMVTDDLLVTPGSMISSIDLIQEHVKDIGALEKRVVEFGADEVLELLGTSLQSDVALTSVFLLKKEPKDIDVSN